MAMKEAAPQVCATESDYTPFDLVKDRKGPTLVFVGATMLSVVLILLGGVVMDWFPDAPLWISSVLSAIGYLVMALPILVCVVPIFGRPIDIGPVFTTHTVIVGNRREERTVRDYEAQYASNVLLTFGKYIFMLLLSIIVTPIIALICLSSYGKAYKMAKTYADEQNIPRSKIPGLNPRFLKTVFTIFCIFLLVIFVVGLFTNENYASGGISQIKNVFTFMQVVGKTPEEYYGVSAEDDGWVAAFRLDGGQQVYCGFAPDIGDYYIIDSTLYLDAGQQQWQRETDNSVKQKLLDRHLHTVMNGKYEYEKGEAWADGTGTIHTFDNNTGGGVLSISHAGVLKMYATSKYNNCAFYMEESDFSEFKSIADNILAALGT